MAASKKRAFEPPINTLSDDLTLEIGTAYQPENTETTRRRLSHVSPRYRGLFHKGPIATAAEKAATFWIKIDKSIATLSDVIEHIHEIEQHHNERLFPYPPQHGLYYNQATLTHKLENIIKIHMARYNLIHPVKTIIENIYTNLKSPDSPYHTVSAFNGTKISDSTVISFRQGNAMLFVKQIIPSNKTGWTILEIKGSKMTKNFAVKGDPIPHNAWGPNSTEEDRLDLFKVILDRGFDFEAEAHKNDQRDPLETGVLETTDSCHTAAKILLKPLIVRPVVFDQTGRQTAEIKVNDITC